MPTEQTDPIQSNVDGTRQALRRVVDERLLEARFQPIVELRRGRIAAYECLSRPSKGSGFENALALFDAAENAGMLWDIEGLARNNSFGAASEWPEGVLLFMNCSPQVICDDRFLDSLREGVKRAGVSARRVVIEITERSDEQADTVVLDQVQQLRDEGYQIAIDDVGAGTSGLNRIMSIRPAWLKLDRALVADIDKDRAKKNLVRFMVHFARLSGVRIIAEGIERREELGTLIELGVPYGQGYLLGMPGGYDQRLDPDLRDQMCLGWSSSSGNAMRDPRSVGVVSIVTDAKRLASTETATEAARMCLMDRTLQGVIAMDGHESVGWVSREQMLRAASDGRAEMPISTLITDNAPRVCGSTTIVEALEIAASRGGVDASAPLIVTDGERVRGIVTVSDLISTAAEVCRAVQTRTNQSSGLPGRVRCDERVLELIDRYGAEGVPKGGGPDAAFIDIQNLASYNEAFGFELGDELIQELVGQLCSLANAGGRDAFLGHLGDDRFLLITSKGRIRSLASKLVEGFNRRLRHNELLLVSSTGGPAPVAVRINIQLDPFRHIGSVRAFYDLEERGRRPAVADAPLPGRHSQDRHEAA